MAVLSAYIDQYVVTRDWFNYCLAGNAEIRADQYGPSIGWLSGAADHWVELAILEDLLIESLPVS